MESEIWHVIVEITRIPDMKKKELDKISWLTDPFGDKRVYSSKFSIEKEKFKWKFLLREGSKIRAVEIGHRLLTYLKELYPGLDGLVNAKPVKLFKINRSREIFFELILPFPPFYNGPISFIKKIVNLYEVTTQYKINIYILWKSITPNMV